MAAMLVKRFLPVASLVLIALLLGSATASADDLGVLDAKAESPGNLAIDGAGNAYIAWTSDNGSEPDNVVFCKVPAGGSACASKQVLPLPAATSGNPEPTAAFPVLAPGNVLYVVAPRYVENDVAVWKSTDGGNVFAAPVTEPAGYSNKTDPTDAFFNAGNIMIGAHNAGLGFSTASGAGGEARTSSSNANSAPAGSPGRAPASTASTRSPSTGTSPPRRIRCSSSPTTAPAPSPKNRTGSARPRSPTATNRASPAGPPDSSSPRRTTRRAAQYPTVLDVRKYSGTAGASGRRSRSPTTLKSVSSTAAPSTSPPAAPRWPSSGPGNVPVTRPG